jgi:hypothetical protein
VIPHPNTVENDERAGISVPVKKVASAVSVGSRAAPICLLELPHGDLGRAHLAGRRVGRRRTPALEGLRQVAHDLVERLGGAVGVLRLDAELLERAGLPMAALASAEETVGQILAGAGCDVGRERQGLLRLLGVPEAAHERRHGRAQIVVGHRRRLGEARDEVLGRSDLRVGRAR